MATQETRLLQKTYLKDYQSPDYLVKQLNLSFDLSLATTLVTAKTCFRRIGLSGSKDLFLHGDDLKLLSVKVDQQLLTAKDYQLNSDGLHLRNLPDEFTLEIITEIHPKQNTQLSGLYGADGLLCTQCEAQGFRRITFYLDRPDVMTVFTTTLIADLKQFPVLLANGNCIDKQILSEGRHSVTWQDPFKKPAYLFALVAGNLVAVEDYFVTRSNKLVTLKIYVEPQNIDYCAHALQSLKKAMLWDEQAYDREYDLDIYMIVAVNSFNMGAMENKGLNIFNAKYILARPESATDSDLEAIEAVVAHEYFHNWSGNRITCRDWFQLSLKEGLTVFREQHFVADQLGYDAALIKQAGLIRTLQFPEDAGPLAHPVRPESYLEIDNFYTMTVYEKGAEIIRMMHTLLGKELFKKAMNHYFTTYDGQAVTIEELVKSMEVASGLNLEQFRLWYFQAGTPRVTVVAAYDEKSQSLKLKFKQSCPSTPQQPDKKPLHIPLQVGLLTVKGQAMALQLKGEANSMPGVTRLLELKNTEETFEFISLKERPILSVLRDFSAPIIIERTNIVDDMALLWQHDPNGVARYDAGQELYLKIILAMAANNCSPEKIPENLVEVFCSAFKYIAKDKTLEPNLKCELLSFPSLNYLLDQKSGISLEALALARSFLKKRLATELLTVFHEIYLEMLQPGTYRYTPNLASMRRLKNLALYYMVGSEDEAALKTAMLQLKSASNMTDKLGALSALSHIESPYRLAALDYFYETNQHLPFGSDKWLAVQAQSEHPDTFKTVQALCQHPAFDMKVPNKVYSLLVNFAANNPLRFHQLDGQVYPWVADWIIKIDGFNPQVAARLVKTFARLHTLDAIRVQSIKHALKSIETTKNLSKDVAELVENLSIMPA